MMQIRLQSPTLPSQFVAIHSNSCVRLIPQCCHSHNRAHSECKSFLRKESEVLRRERRKKIEIQSDTNYRIFYTVVNVFVAASETRFSAKRNRRELKRMEERIREALYERNSGTIRLTLC